MFHIQHIYTCSTKLDPAYENRPSKQHINKFKMSSNIVSFAILKLKYTQSRQLPNVTDVNTVVYGRVCLRASSCDYSSKSCWHC